MTTEKTFTIETLRVLYKLYELTEAENPIYLSNIALCVFNAFLCYTAIALNSVTMYVTIKTSSLLKPLKTLLLSLAVSDLGVGLISQPLYIAIVVMELQPNFENNPAYKTTYKAFLVPLNLLYYASFFGVTALTVDRFLSIHLHLKYQELVTHKPVVSAILSLIGVLLSQKDKYVIFATFEAVCLITTAVLYCQIYIAVRHHTNQIHALQIQQEAQNGEMATAARLRKSAVGTFYVYLVFLVCYLPQNCIYHVTIISGSSTAIMVLNRYALTMTLLNLSLNPLIYCWKTRHIRRAIMDTMQKILPSHN